MTKKTSRERMERDILDLCKGSIYSFERWDDTDHGMESRFQCRCQLHGVWRVSAKEFIKGGTRCRECAYIGRRNRFQLGKEECELRVKSCIANPLWSFIGWKSGHKNKDSKIIMQCANHGVWTPTFHNFTHQETGCPGCAKSGFKPWEDSVLYALVSDDGGMIKIGISNNFKVRLPGLKHATPFRFSVVEVVPMPGDAARCLEKGIHSRYESAGLTGFGGATEWLVFNQKILHEVRNIAKG